MSELFETLSINNMTLNNRFVRSATWEGVAGTDGTVTARLNEMMAELARNEVGLIITGYAFVSPEGQSSPRQLAAYEEGFVQGLGEMAGAVQAAGGRIALQLVHGGRFAAADLTGQLPMGPMAEESEGQVTCLAMGKDDILSVITSFAKAALRTKEAGFDAVQLHAAHGFLLSQFLSPALNQRDDEYGGSLENRARLLLEVVQAVREAVGPDYPLLVKLNSEDFLDCGMPSAEAVEVARRLEAASVNAIELSGGTILSQDLMPPRPGLLKSHVNEVYYRKTAQLYKEKVSIPLMLVGGVRSIEVAEELVQSGVADFISLSRPLVAEPGLIKRWHEGDRRKAECLSCNACFGPALSGEGLYCVPLARN